MSGGFSPMRGDEVTFPSPEIFCSETTCGALGSGVCATGADLSELDSVGLLLKDGLGEEFGLGAE